MPGIELAVALYAVFAVLLVIQPDFGQTLLVTLVWGALFYMAGINMVWIGALGAAGVAGIVSAYFLVPHVASRIDRFLDPASGDTYQADRSLNSFLHGGWFGRGPGEGTVKNVLPDSHTDFIFAVTAEEYGLIACLILLALFAFIVLRGLSKASQEPDGFISHAVAGLIMLFGLQALINMAVNVGLLPAKGMTLPFISYGGSSLLAMALTMGFALGLTRKRPMAGQIKRGAHAQAQPNRSASGSARRDRAAVPSRRGRHGRASLSRRGARAGARSAAAMRSSSRPTSAPRNTASSFPARAIHRIPSATLREPQSRRHGQDLLPARHRLFRRASPALSEIDPRAVIGFGGYPTLPPIIAARTLRHPDRDPRAERGDGPRQPSAVALRRSRRAVLLADQAAAPQRRSARRSVTGTPVRDAVLAYREVPYVPPEPGGPLLLLVFGGSQGAHFFSEALPQALALSAVAVPLAPHAWCSRRARRISTALREAYKEAGVAAHLAPFFRDLPERIANAHLVIARAGASTVAELMAIGRPCLLVPLPHALDNDQLENATRLQQGGGGWCIRQSELTPERLAAELERLFDFARSCWPAPRPRRKAMAETEAVSKLADLAEELARQKASVV